MTKLAVYDNENKDRLLGYLEAKSYYFRTPRFAMVVDQPPLRDSLTSRLTLNPMKRLTFHVDVRRITDTKEIDEATLQTTITERKCFRTDALLSDLVKLENFTLPEGSPYEA